MAFLDEFTFQDNKIINKDLVLLEVDDSIPFTMTQVLSNVVNIDFPLFFDFIEERKDIFEVKLYVQKSKDLKISISDRFVNTFRLKEQVNIDFLQKQIQIEFSLVEGKGNFWGHIFFSNRLAHDWIIGLRTIQRASNCRICAKICIT